MPESFFIKSIYVYEIKVALFILWCIGGYFIYLYFKHKNLNEMVKNADFVHVMLFITMGGLFAIKRYDAILATILFYILCDILGRYDRYFSIREFLRKYF